MNDSTTLDLSSWFAPAGILIQLAFLIAAVWFARNYLKTMRAFQEQIGALLKLSITGVTAERNFSAASTSSPMADASPYWLAPTESEPVTALQPTERGPSRITVIRRRMLLWLQSPMTTTQPAPWRRIVTWLQSPAGN
jgi:hypothetical protein